MIIKNSDQPASWESTDDYGGKSNNEIFGLTKREYFAIKCLQGILSSNTPEWNSEPVRASESAIKYADELLKQLESPTTIANRDTR